MRDMKVTEDRIDLYLEDLNLEAQQKVLEMYGFSALDSQDAIKTVSRSNPLATITVVRA